MKKDPDIDYDNLQDSMKLSPEERIIRCSELSAFMAELNPKWNFILENDRPGIFKLSRDD